MIAASLSLLLQVTAFALAAPWGKGTTTYGTCNVPTTSAVKLPSSFDPVASPPRAVGITVGTQKYSCNKNGTYDVGAVKFVMYDISCLYASSGPNLSTIQTDAYNDWNAFPGFDPSKKKFVKLLKNHYGITPAASTQFDFHSNNGIIHPLMDFGSIGIPFSPAGGIKFNAPPSQLDSIKRAPSPDGPENLDWLEIDSTNLLGGLTNRIYHINTVHGSPPSTSCTPGSHASVKYSGQFVAT